MEIPLTLVRLDESGRPTKGQPSALRYGIPLWYRILSAVIAAVLVAANATASLEPGYRLTVMGAIVMIIAIVAAVYEERWTFSSAERRASARLGLVFLAKRVGFSFDDMARVKVDTFVKGKLNQADLPPPDKMPRGSLARLIVELKDGQGFLINSVPFKNRERLEEVARAISDLSGAPLED